MRRRKTGQLIICWSTIVVIVVVVVVIIVIIVIINATITIGLSFVGFSLLACRDVVIVVAVIIRNVVFWHEYQRLDQFIVLVIFFGRFGIQIFREVA